MKKVYTISAYIMLSVSVFSQDLMHTTEFNWAEKFSDRSVEIWGVLQVDSPIFDDFLANAPDDRIVINRRGCEFHTDGTEEFSGLPTWVTVRAELREQPMSTVPTGFTHVYEYIWDVDMLPVLEGPVTIFQRFNKANDGPDLDIELNGKDQFNDAPTGSVLIHGFNSGWVRTQKELKARNHLLIAIYSEASGHYKISLNGETLLENDAYTIADQTYSGQQFGIYNHGGTVDRIQFTHIWYRCSQYSGKADFSQLESTDPNITSVSSPQRVSSIAKNFTLKQNYPNPFSAGRQGSAYGGDSQTTIEYTLPPVKQSENDQIQSVNFNAAVNVSLKVYDLLGREVATIVNDTHPPGAYKVVFDASHLTNGIYLYTLKAGEYISTKKMILLR